MTAPAVPSPPAARLSVEGLTVALASGGYLVRPLERLDFTASDGEFVVVLGPSGCGKTTLLSCLAGLLTPTAGSIVVEGVNVSRLRGVAITAYRRRTVGIVFQAFNLIPSLSVRANIALPLLLGGMRRAEAYERADRLIDVVGLGDRRRHRPGQLSGGQQQRVAIARALVYEPPVLLADEPTAHLDHVQVEGILRLLRDLAHPGRTVVVATHDDRITRLADRVVHLGPAAAEGRPARREVTLALGELLFRQGDPSDLVYLLLDGEVEVYRELIGGREEHAANVRAGGYVGELGPLLDLPRSASVRATARTRVLGLPVEEFRQQFPGALGHRRGTP